MSPNRWLSSLQGRLRSKKANRRRHRANPSSGFQDWLLENRCLMSRGGLHHRDVKTESQSTIYVENRAGDDVIGPYTLQNPSSGGAGAVIFLGGTSPNTGSYDWGNVPQKVVTFTNKSNNHETIYPFLYSPNNEQIYDPIDTANDEYRLYIGYENNAGDFVLGLPYGKTITIDVPLVFWNGGRADIATDGADFLPKSDQVQTLNPYEFTYGATTYITQQGVVKSSDNDGILMYYKANTPGAPVNPSPAAPGQLTEWTIRDQSFLTTVNAYDQNNNLGSIPSSELTTLINYDVSYVDDLMAPVAMAGTQVPVPIQYIQNGTATTAGNTTTIDLAPDDAALLKLLTEYLPYQTDPWQVKFNSSATDVIDMGTITNVSGDTVTVVNSGPVSGLPAGTATYVFSTSAVKADYGWTGANNDIAAMQKEIAEFTTKNSTITSNENGLGLYFGGLGWPKYYNPNSDALLKIPSGASILINSPLTTATSPFDINRYLLTSGNDGERIFYNAHENLDPTSQPTNQNDEVTFNVSGADLAAIKEHGGTWVLSDSFDTTGNHLIGTIDDSKIDVAAQTITVTLAQSIPNLPSGYSYVIVAPPSDPYAKKITDLWYSWANYYVNQFASSPAPGTVSATVSADTDSTNDTRILTLSTPDPQLAVGMSVTGQDISSLTTILRITTANNIESLYLSAPVPTALSGQTVPFTFSNPQPIAYNNDPNLKTDLISASGFGNDAAFATAFAGSVYELMSAYSTVPVEHTLLPNRSMDLVYEAIGGNVGFLPSNVNQFTQITADVRDLGKSVLRGVPNFLTYQDQHTTDSQWQPGDWYPPPSTPTDGADFNVYNLDPFVWFVHQKLGLSGYGFSFDDDVSDVGAGGTSSLDITYASGPAANPTTSQWFPSTPWGAVTAMATISAPLTSGQWKGDSILTIEPQDTAAYWQVSADDKNNGLVGAYVSTTARGIGIPPKTNLYFNLNSNTLQFVLSRGLTATTTPIPVTFTGYLPQLLKSAKSRR
jgi:hypothetical protein